MKKPKSKFKKIIKWSIVGFISLIVLLVIAIFAIPYFFKDEILALAKKEINKNINATVDFSDADLSLLTNFPELTFSMNDLTVTGVDKFEGIPLASMKRMDFSMNLMSAIRPKEGEPIGINSISLVQPDINILVLRDGKANYDIAKSSGAETNKETTSSEPASFKLNLSNYSIQKGKFVYDDRQGNTYLKIEDLNHSGKGNFTEAIYDINTKTNIGALTANSGGVSYLKKAKLDATIKINADMNTNKYTIKDNSIQLNAMKLNTDGWVQTEGNNTNMDLKFDAPSSQFKHLLSMIPGAYTKDFEGVDANGTFKFNGAAKGTLNDTKLPAFHLNLDVADGSFKYPDLPLGMKDIVTQIKINSQTSNLDQMTIQIPKFHMLLGQNPFDAQLNLKTPISDPDIDAILKGIINLEELSKAFPMEGVKSLNGILTSDITAKTKMSYIDNQQYDKVDMKGNLKLENINYNAEGMPPVVVQLAQMNFTPQNVKLDNFNARLGKSDIQANGTLDNILAYFSPEKTMTGKLTLRSQLFDANEWLEGSETTSTTESSTATPTSIPESDEVEIFDRFKFELDAEMDKILYEDYELKNTVAKGSFTPDEVNLSSLGTKVGNSDIAVDGKITNVFPFLFDNETLGGNINLKSQYLDLNELTGYTESTGTPSNENAKTTSPPPPTEEGDVILVPDNMHISLNTDIKKVKYTNLVLDQLKGVVSIANEKIELKDVVANLLGGRAKLVGGYDTSNKTKPLFELGYDISKFDFQKSFKTLNTFQAAAPIGEFIKGIFNSTFSMKGVLGKDMMPDLNTLTASGDFLTIDALIQNFIPMKEIGNQLNISYLKDDIKIQNTKNYFKIQDGKIQVEEFPFQYKDIDMKVGGSHGFDQNIDYVLKLDVPIELIGKGKVAGYASSGLDMLGGVASKAGLNLGNLNVGEKVNIVLNLTGLMNKPKVKVISVKMSGEGGQSTKDALIDSVKDMAEDKINEIKDEVIDKVEDKVETVVDDVKDKVEDKVETVVDDVKDKVEDKVNDAVKDKVDDVKDKVEDSVKDKVDDKVKDKVDELKDKFNPFGKKKNKNKDD